jgi:hypothetical protein
LAWASHSTTLRELIKRENRYSQRIRSYIGGEEINGDPCQRHHRFVIDVSDLRAEEVENEWPDLWVILDRFVRPDRQREKNRKNGPMYSEWWKFWRSRPELYNAIEKLDHVLILSRVSPHLCLA